MCLSSLTALTNRQKYSGLTQHTLISLPFCRSEVWHGSPWGVKTVMSGLYPILEGQGRIWFCHPFSRTKAFLTCGTYPPSENQRHPFSLSVRPLGSFHSNHSKEECIQFNWACLENRKQFIPPWRPPLKHTCEASWSYSWFQVQG